MKKEKEVPSWLRIVLGIIIFIVGGALSICAATQTSALRHIIDVGNLSIFPYFLGKLLISFLAGLSIMCWFAFNGVIGLVAFYVARGKEKFFENISPAKFEIMPFPSPFNTEDLQDIPMERIDDKFLIFDYGRPIRKFTVIVGLVAAIAVAIPLYMDMDKPSSDAYSPPGPGFVMTMLLMSLYGAIAPSRRFVLDRMNSTITYPRHIFFPRLTITFSKVRVGRRYSGLAFIHPYTNLGIPTAFEHTKGWWCFLLLYMDKNRPLPQGTVFTPYREKDFLRRKSEGFPKPIYPNSVLVTDAYMGYIYGTDEFKEKLNKMKHNMIHCYDRVSWYCQDHNIEIPNDNDLVLIAIWKQKYVFKLFAPEHVEYIVIPDNAVLTDCFLCDGYTAEVTQLK